MLPLFQENLSIFTGKFYIFRRETHDFSGKPKNQRINKKISIPEKSVNTSPITISKNTIDTSINAHAYLLQLCRPFRLRLRSIKHEVMYFKSSEVNVRCRNLCFITANKIILP